MKRYPGKYLRNDIKSMTQTEFAEKYSSTQSSVSRMWNKKRDWSLPIIEAINEFATRKGVSLDDMWEYSDGEAKCPQCHCVCDQLYGKAKNMCVKCYGKYADEYTEMYRKIHDNGYDN